MTVEELERTQNAQTLALFVHGLGADATQFWGSTPTAVRTHPKLTDYAIEFWGYPTNHGPTWYPGLIRQYFGGRNRRESIAELGESLWSELVRLDRNGSYKKIVLVGHSMGGLVVAAALGFGLQHRRATDSEIASRIASCVLVATPLGGARLAKTARRMYRPIGANIHLDDLRADSTTRREIVTSFVHLAVEQCGIVPHLLRARGDSAVLKKEAFDAVPENMCIRDSLVGGHSDCVQNLEAGSSNLDKIVNAMTSGTRDHRGVVTRTSDLNPMIDRGVVDVEGSPDQMELLFKAKGFVGGRHFLKSTKAMEVPGGCLVQVSTELRGEDGGFAPAEAIEFVPGVRIERNADGSGGRLVAE